MSGFAMKTASVFLPLLKPGTKARMAHAAALRKATERQLPARRQDKGNDRGLEAYKITALTNVRFWGRQSEHEANMTCCPL